MPKEERELLIQKLSEIDSRYARGELEEECIDAYDTTVKRIKAYFDKNLQENF